MKHSVTSWARVVGNSLAHVQHSMDKAIDWSFQQMQKQAKDSGKTAAKGKEADPVVRTGKGILRFLGEAGNAYYRTYDELKRKKP